MESQDKVKRPGPTASWDRVSYLKIQSPSGQPNVKVFSNYFQACQVNVVVRFALGPDEVAITRAEAMAATSVVTAGTHQRPDFRAHGFAELYSSAPEYTWNEDIMNRFAALPAAINIACEAYTNQDILSRLNSNQMIAAPSDPDIEWDPHWLMRQVPNANNKIVRTLLQNLKSKPVEPSPIPQAPRAVDGQDEGIAVLEHTLTFYIAATDTAIGSLDVVARVHRPDYVYEYSDEFSPRSVVTIQAIPPYVPPPTTGFLYNTAKGEFIFSPRNSDRENFVWQESAIQLTISSTLIKFLPLSEGTFQLVWSDEFYAGAEQWEWEWEWGVFYIGAPVSKEFRGKVFAREKSCYYTRYLNHPSNPLRNIKDRSIQLSGGSFNPPSALGVPIGRLCSKDNDWILNSDKKSSPYYLTSDRLRLRDEFGTPHDFKIQVSDVATLVLIRI